MNVERTDLNATHTKLLITAGASDLEPVKRHVLAHFRHNVKVPGFRAGTAPVALVEKHIDQRLLLDEFMEHALNQLYAKAIQQQNLRPVGKPEVQLKKFVPFTDIQFEAETEIIGEVSLPDYKKIKLSKEPVSITTQDVNEVIESLRQRGAQRKEVNRLAKKGDELIIDFKGKDDSGKPVNGADGQDYPLIMGSGGFIPGFEDKLLGVKPGENKTFKIVFPKDYSVTALQNKEVSFSVTIKKLNELALPKADDKLANKLGPFKTLAELKTDIRKQLKLEREQQAERDLANKVINEIITRSKVEIPNNLIEQEIDRLEDEEKRNLVYRGQTWQEHLKEEGITEKEHRERHKAQAIERIKAGIILGEIADRESITISEAEIKEREVLLKGQYQDSAMQAELEKPQARREIESRLMSEKTIDRLVRYSTKQER